MKKKMIFCVIGIVFISFFFIGGHNCTYPIQNDTSEQVSIRSSSQSVNARPLNVTHHALAQNSVFPLSLPTNVSFALGDGWTSENVTILFDGVSQKRDWVVNGDFSSNSSGWSYESNILTELIGNDWQSGALGEYLEIEMVGGIDKDVGDYGYYEQNISIQEELTQNKLAIASFDYYYDETKTNEISIYIAVVINGTEKNRTIPISDLVIGSWTTTNLVYDAVAFDHILPGDVSIRIGVCAIINGTIQTPNQKIFLDKAKFSIWTKPNQPNLVKAFDNEFNLNNSYINTTYGKGQTFIGVNRNRVGGGDVIFTIFQNVTDVEDFEVKNITIRSNVVRTFNSTYGGQVGSFYIEGLDIEWQTEIFMNPLTYSDSWAEIEKPSDWNVTHLFDVLYSVDRVDDCNGTETGSNRIIIPISVIGQGLKIFKMHATSQNYIESGQTELKNGVSYDSMSIFWSGDIFRVRVALNTSVLTNTSITCIIYQPSGTIFWQNNITVSSSNVTFGDLTIETNTAVGNYRVEVLWKNNASSSSIDKVGFLTFLFSVYHKTTLEAEESQIQIERGDPLLIKIKYMDKDLNDAIGFGKIIWTSTFGQNGTMSYIGSGMYVIDLNTSSIDVGDHYISFNASKDYYEWIYKENLVKLTISPPIDYGLPIIISIIISSLAISILGLYFVYNRYFSLSKTQRKIRKIKKNALKGSIVQKIKVTREGMIDKIFDEYIDSRLPDSWAQKL